MNLGFEKNDIKTKGFEIEAKHEREYDKHEKWKLIFKGYEFNHSMRVEFDKNNELLGKIIRDLSRCTAMPEVSLQYTVKDVEKQKRELIYKVIQDSKIKAEILADASKVTLGKIIRIDYSWGEMKFVSSAIDELMDCMALSDDCDDDFYDMDIEPEDINLSDTVTVVWEIE